MLDVTVLDPIKARLKQADRILIASHIRPDGDAIGSLIGIGLALTNGGKKVTMALTDPVPPNYLFLEGARQIKHSVEGDFDTVIVVDCADQQRTGSILGDRPVDIQFDHHVTNPKFAKFNYVDGLAVATADILANTLEYLGFVITSDVASALMYGIITDTIGFRTSNMTPDCMRTAATLMERGANLPDLYYKGVVEKSFSAARYWGMGLNTLQKSGRIIWAVLTQADRKTVGYNGNDDADLTHLLSSISESDIAVLFIEQKVNRVKVSWRAQPGLDVSHIAMQFGGGGHKAAAGADIEGTLEEVKEKVLSATETYLKSVYPA